MKPNRALDLQTQIFILRNGLEDLRESQEAEWSLYTALPGLEIPGSFSLGMLKAVNKSARRGLKLCKEMTEILARRGETPGTNVNDMGLNADVRRIWKEELGGKTPLELEKEILSDDLAYFQELTEHTDRSIEMLLSELN